MSKKTETTTPATPDFITRASEAQVAQMSFFFGEWQKMSKLTTSIVTSQLDTTADAYKRSAAHGQTLAEAWNKMGQESVKRASELFAA